jgi:hypothetical protein
MELAAMRVEVKMVQKKQDGLGAGFLVGFVVLCSAAYYLGGQGYAGVFPVTVERALANFRSDADSVIESASKSFGNVYRSVAGR